MIVKNLVAMLTLSCWMNSNIQSQQINDGSLQCHQSKVQQKHISKIAVANPAEDNYDVKKVILNLSLDNSSIDIKGEVTTVAKVVVPSMSQYVFELNDNLQIDSVLVNGQKLTAISLGNDIKSVSLPTPLLQNNLFRTQVFYKGSSTGTGIRNGQSQSWGTEVTYTLSEPYAAKDWWPCKQSLKDKIDTALLWITVPDTLKAGANGVLQQVTQLAGNKARYEWTNTTPIDYYLISIAVAPYVDYSYQVHFPNTNDSMLVQNYVYGDNAQTLPYWKQEIDSVKDMILYFSSLVGRYPFWKEKYGHCMAPLNGGMEHQTMTTLGNFGTVLTAHELFHHWFGDHVTCATWADIWLNEGFAAYGEYLFKEKFWSKAKADQHMLSKHNNVFSDMTGTVYVNDTTQVNRIFSTRLTYDKGAAVVHSLRFVVGNDSLFFAMLSSYQQQFANSTATIQQFKIHASQFLQQNLDTFFNQWIYEEGYPIFSASWNQTDSTIIIKMNQTATSGATTSFFQTPLELKLTSALKDTFVRVSLQATSSQTIYIHWKQTMTGMQIDPNNWLLNLDQGTIKDISLTDIKEIESKAILAYPNPTTYSWNMTLPMGFYTHYLYDINGSLIKQLSTSSNRFELDAQAYPSGVYYLKSMNQFSTTCIKLIKQ